MEMLRDLWTTPLAGGLEIRHVVEVAIALLLLRVIYRFVRSRPKASNVGTREVACSCGWRGQASAHRPRCPRCGRDAFPV